MSSHPKTPKRRPTTGEAEREFEPSAEQGATIDGRPVVPLKGETILSAARRFGIEIPTLCYSADLPPEGGCRVCLVETRPGGGYEAACHTPLRSGMQVRTASAKLDQLRHDILGLMAEALPAASSSKSKGTGEWASLLKQFNVESFNGADSLAVPDIDDSHPYLRFDVSRCITCRRCLNACEHIQGQFVYGMEHRGPDTRLIFGPGRDFALSACTACGACVDHCPSGAITDRDRMGGEATQQTTDSTCGYCGVGCQVRVEAADGRVLRIAPVPGAAANHDHLCAKGRYAHAWHRSPERLTHPLLRKGDNLVEVSWDEALAWAAERLQSIHREHGPGALAAISSSRSTNEAGYLLQKLFRAVFGSNNVDCCARVCHSSTALALQTVTGTGAASASYVDIERAKLIVIAGSNPTEAHPVVGARIKQAVLGGAKLIVIDPRRIELAEYADLHLQLRPGTNVALFNGLVKSLLDQGLQDRAYVDERTEGLDELLAFVAKLELKRIAETTGVPLDAILSAARMMGATGPTLFVHGLGLSELTQGTASVMTLCNLGMLTGSIGKPGAGMLPLRGQNNVQGNADMGGMPSHVTGYQPLADPEVRARLEREWGSAPPPEAGLTIPEMFDAAIEGRVRAMWIQGEDVAQSEPHQGRTLEALEKLELLIIQDPFLCETAKYADLILPACGTLENDGTYTSGERRIQRVRPAVPAPGEARQDWIVVRDTARALGHSWDYESPADVMDEIARVAPRLFGGVSYDRLGRDGIQWPCHGPHHAGTETVHADGFLRGKGRLVSIDYAPSPEVCSEGFPLLLVTGRILQQYNVGTMTRRTPNQELAPDDVLEIHPDDFSRLGFTAGGRARIESRWGETEAPVRASARIAPGTLFLSFHQPESAANRLIGPHVDPLSKCPEYKVTAVRAAPA